MSSTIVYPHSVHSEIVRSVLRNLVIRCIQNPFVVILQNSTAGSDDGSAIMTAASDITIDITLVGVNGLDTGSPATGWYYVYMIWNPTSGLVQGLLSASMTSPVMPSGYTSKRLVGTVRYSGGFLFSNQVGNEVFYLNEASQLLWSGVDTTGNWFAMSTASFVPPLARIVKKTDNLQLLAGATDSSYWYKPGQLAGVGSGGVVFSFADSGDTEVDGVTIDYFVVDDPAQQFSLYFNTSGGTPASYQIWITGYKLDL